MYVANTEMGAKQETMLGVGGAGVKQNMLDIQHVLCLTSSAVLNLV